MEKPGYLFAHQPWRTGQKLKRTIYIQMANEPSDMDPFLAMFDSVDVARYIVDLHNSTLPNARETVSSAEDAGGDD